ncbi:MAG: UDP-N-acetylmuramoyl-tripeptide--D-alanyl-D-alanine ligase [Armatimonadota bacterium]|nr:MAG: UDP-N-acetylmuramoyl-tripeptide--D-alanyl-D-alanine ligase [Armatimonadota bacterium]
MRDLSLQEIASACGGDIPAGAEQTRVVAVVTDSRKCVPGALFVALSGERTDGHQFVRAAFGKGASAAMVRRDWYRSQVDALPGPCVSVDDPLAALGRLGHWARKLADIPVVGLTGSMGKTTTREMLALLLRLHHRPLVSPANLNTEIGVPLTLLDLDETHDCAVIEMAMRGRGQIAELCRIARPTAGLITNIGLAHLELLGSQQAIAESKAELLEGLPAGAWSVLPAEGAFAGFLRGKAPGPVITFGTSADADFRVEDLQLDASGCAQFILVRGGDRVPVALRVPGEFHALNAAAAVAAAARFGVTLQEAAGALSRYEGFDRRSRVVQAPAGWTVFDDTYNASPDAMEGALRGLAAMKSAGRKIAVLGDMRELGEVCQAEHERIGRAVIEAAPAMLVTVGEDSRIIQRSALQGGYPGETHHFASSGEAAEFLAGEVRAGDLVLVKGSRALEMERVVERLVG